MYAIKYNFFVNYFLNVPLNEILGVLLVVKNAQKSNSGHPAY